MNKLTRKWVLAIAAILLPVASYGAATPPSDWSAESYRLYPGDFNGDGFTDMLYVARKPGFLNGIALSDGKGLNVSLQTWDNAYLGIAWSDDLYNVIVADFDGDGRSDVLMQRKAEGDHYLILTEDGGLGGISQTVAENAMGLGWSAKHHALAAGDFNGDGHADLFFQAADADGLNAVVLTDALGQFTDKEPRQSWDDGYAGFKWASTEAVVFASDFNGDGLADLLLQAQPLPHTPGGDVQFEPNMNGVVLAQAADKIFVTEGVQSWSRDGFAADWSPLSSAVVIGNFNDDELEDVILQAIPNGNASYILYGRPDGAIFTDAEVLDSKTTPAQQDNLLFAGRFSDRSSGLFAQSVRSSRVNYLAKVTDGGLVVTDPDASFSSLGAPIGSGTAPPPPASAAAIVTPTSAGRTPGEFAVNPHGAATYSIPLWSPPGARGVEPHLSVVYSSNAPDGALGPGWNLSGLSAIARCNKSFAANAGAPAPVALSMTDDYCLDGNRLRVTTGNYGALNSKYQTEVANFKRVTALGPLAGNGPSNFLVEGKDGLLYEYGNTADSKAYSASGGTPYAWFLNKVRDRQGNNLKVVYSSSSGSIQPSSIEYTQTPTTSTTYPYKISFTYQARQTDLSKFIAAGEVQQTQVLSKITVLSGTTSVRQYNFVYSTAPTTQRDRLTSIQECGGSAGTDCLRATTISYQNGSAGVASPATASGSSTTNGTVNTADIDGDGQLDLVFARTSGANYQWFVQLATPTGYSAPKNTGAVTSSSANVLLDDFLGDGSTEILAPSGGYWHAYQWDGTSAFTDSNTTIAVDVNLGAGQAASADGDGDGLPDLWTAPASGTGSFTIYARRNTSAGGALSFAPTALSRTSYAWQHAPQVRGNNSVAESAVKHMDLNGDGREEVLITSDVAPVPPLSGGALIGIGFNISGSLIVPAGGFGGLVQSIIPARWNDDNCTDAITSNGVAISPCGSTQSSPTITLAGAPELVFDWDGDGRSDVFYNSGGTWKVQRSLSTAVSAAVSTGIPVGSGSWTVTDQDGDSLSDLAFSDSSASGAIKYGAHNGALTPADLVTVIKDGWQIGVSIAYTSIAKSNYTKYLGTPASFPEYDYQGPIFVVKQSNHDDGIGSTYSNYYYYWSARINREGRGFEGFARTRTQDSRNDLYHYVYYKQAFPYTGGIEADRVYQSDATTLISITSNHYSIEDLSGTNCSNRCFPYVDTATTTNYDITAGAPLTDTSVVSYQYDSNGNATQVSTTKTDKFASSPFYNLAWSSVVGNTYVNDQTNWCISLPTSTTVTNTVPGQSALTRRVNHTVNGPNCRFQTETVEPTSLTLKVTTTYDYDTCGNNDSLSVVGLDETGAAMPARVSTADYGARCQFAESVTDAQNETKKFTYNYSIGKKATESDLNGTSGFSTAWTYDNFARPTLEDRPDNTSTTWEYEDCVTGTCFGSAVDLRLKITETLLNTSGTTVRTHEQFLDGLERLRFDEGNRVLGTWTNVKIVYDAMGRESYVYNPYSSSANGYRRKFYDVLNRLTSEKTYDTTPTIDRETFYEYAGNSVAFTDHEGHVTTRWTDVSGQLRRVVDPAPGGATNYTFDPFGNLKQIVDATSKTTSYGYNLRGFRTSSGDPDAGTWSYAPNSLNELISQTDAKGQVTSFEYDKLGRMTARYENADSLVTPVVPTTWTYGTSPTAHNVGQIVSVSKPDGYGESYLYDALARQQKTTYTMDGLSYAVDSSYNNIGALDVLTYPVSTSSYRFAVKYIYSYGFVSQVKDNAAGGATFWSVSAANDYSSPTTEMLGNGIKITSIYRTWTNELVARKEGSGASLNNLQDLIYDWDRNGNLSKRQDVAQNLTEVFTNDSMNRLTNSTLNGNANLAVTYDDAGNILTKSDVGAYSYTNQAGCPAYSHAQPHAVRKAGSTVYCYDQNGNMTKRAGADISWFSYNQPKVINYGSNSSTFSYNADHQRWKHVADYAGATETTWYIGGLLEKFKKGTVTEFRHYIPAGSGVAIYTRRDNGTNNTYYATTDQLGSADLVTDSSVPVNVLASESFTPFGARRGSNWTGNPTTADYNVFGSTTRRGFTGHEMLDAVSLVNMNGRILDPYTGRTLSVDPVIPSLSLGQSVNPYAYVMNNPLSWVDPSGYSFLGKLFKKIVNYFKQQIINYILDAFNDYLYAINPWLAVAAVVIEVGFEIKQSAGSHQSYDIGFSQTATASGAFVIGAPSTGPPGSWGTGGPATIGGMPILYENGSDAGSTILGSMSLPQTFVDFVTGFGDGIFTAVTFGFANLQDTRDALNVSGGVSTRSASYRTGSVAGVSLVNYAPGGGLVNVGARVGVRMVERFAAKWTLGSGKSATKWGNQMAKRGWNEKQIGEALSTKGIPARNAVNPGNPATRHVHPETGQSVVIDNKTNEIIHVGGKNFDYSDWDLLP